MVEFAIVTLELFAFYLAVRFQYWVDMQILGIKADRFQARFIA